MKRATALALAALFLACAVPLEAGQPASVSWRNIPSFVGDKEIEVRDGGSRWIGHVISVSPDALTIADRDKGRTSIPRASVQTFRMKSRGKLWTIVGTGIGVAVGAGLGIIVNTYTFNEGTSAPGITAAAVGIPTGVGFLLGFAADSRHKVAVRVTD